MTRHAMCCRGVAARGVGCGVRSGAHYSVLAAVSDARQATGRPEPLVHSSSWSRPEQWARQQQVAL